ncbi:MAG: polysaccharide deacetylase family protein [Sciscionella sp.]
MSRKREPRQWSWPNGEQIAFSVGIAFEGFDLISQYAHGPRGSAPDAFSLSFADYGSRAGIWRLLDLLDEFDIKANVSASGKAAVDHPQVVRAVADAGHEVNAHGWVNDAARPSDPPGEHEEIERCTAAILASAGVRPVGWTGPGSISTPETLRLLVEAGYIWSGDAASDDLPYPVETPAGPIMVLPRTNIFHNDLIMWLGPLNSPAVLWDGFRDTFDELYAEGTNGHPKWTEITLHAHIAGRPTAVPTIRRCLEYVREHDGVWCAPRRDIARWAAQREDVSLPA